VEKSEVVATLEDDGELARGAIGRAAPRQVRAESIGQVEQEREHRNESDGRASAMRRRAAAQLAHRRVPLHRQRQQHQHPNAWNSIKFWLAMCFFRTEMKHNVYSCLDIQKISKLDKVLIFPSMISLPNQN
jgi:hypothetical protein